MNRDLLERILTHDSVPTVPAFALKMLNLCGDPDVSLMEVALTVQNDGATSAKLLKLANSSLFGLSREVSTVNHAVSLLGLRTVRTTAVATALVGGLARSRSEGFDQCRFWRSSLVTALAARKVAEQVGEVAPDEAFVCGLLQDIGSYLMFTTLGSRYGDLVDEAGHIPGKLFAREEQEFLLNHAEVGAQLLESWQFPDVLVAGVRQHETVTDASGGDPAGRMAACLRLAECYRCVFFHPGPAQVETLLDLGERFFGMDAETTIGNLSFIDMNASQVADAFELDIGDPSDLQAARQAATGLLVDLILKAQGDYVRSEAGPQGVPADQRDPTKVGLTVFRVEVDNEEPLRERVGRSGLNRILATVVDELSGTLRKSDILLRWGEFGVVVLAPMCWGEDAESLARRFLQALQCDAITTSRGAARVSVSIGAAWNEGFEGEGFRKLMEEAERNVRRAQERGGNLFVCGHQREPTRV